MNSEKVISTFEKIINVCKEDECDFVDLTFEDAEQVLALLKDQNKIIQNVLLEKANELNDKITTLQIEEQNREIRRLSAWR